MEKIFDTLLGSKVLLRPFLLSDITPEYIAWLNDPEVVKYSNQRFMHHTEKSCKEFYERFSGSDNIFISIRMQDNDQAVGTMTAYVSGQHETADVGIMVGNRSVWSRGIGQDAWNTLLAWLINQRGIRKVTAGTMQCNQGMINIMERSGMYKEAVQTAQELLDGIPQDIVYYAKFTGLS